MGTSRLLRPTISFVSIHYGVQSYFSWVRQTTFFHLTFLVTVKMHQTLYTLCTLSKCKTSFHLKAKRGTTDRVLPPTLWIWNQLVRCSRPDLHLLEWLLADPSWSGMHWNASGEGNQLEVLYKSGSINLISMFSLSNLSTLY